MEWKVVEIKGKLVSAKLKALKVFKLISGFGRDGSNVSSPTPVFTVAPYEPVKPFTNYVLEAELKKAEALAYCRMLDPRK